MQRSDIYRSSKVVHAWRAVLLTASFSALTACNDSSPTAPSPPPVSTTLQSVEIGGTTAVAEGMQTQLTVTANYSDGRTREVTNTSSYSSSDDSIATVSATGLVTGVRSGQAIISASYEEGSIRKEGQKSVSVQREIPEYEISLRVDSIRIIEDCDPGPIIQDGPGEFTYRISSRFPDDAGLLTLTERSSTISRSNGQSISIGRTRTERVQTDSASLSVESRLTEWDGNSADSNMNNRRASRTHRLSGGQWTGTGSNSVAIGSGRCRATLNYTFSARQLN